MVVSDVAVKACRLPVATRTVATRITPCTPMKDARHPPPELHGKETAMSAIDGKEFVLAGIVMKRLLSGEQTAGQFCLFDNKSDGTTKTPIHVHARDDETIYIIE